MTGGFRLQAEHAQRFERVPVFAGTAHAKFDASFVSPLPL
jgi:hypothetical protein